MLKRCVVLLAAWLVIASQLQSARAQVVARLLEVNGNVVIRAAEGDTRTAEVYGAVSNGDKLVMPDKASVVIGWHESGQLQRVSGVGETSVRERSAEPGPGVQVEPITLQQGELVANGVKALRDLPSGANVTRGVKDKPLRPSIAPIFGSTVLSVEPTFSWPARQDAVQYRLRLHTNEGQLWEKQPKESKLPYPSPKPLERGLSYQWVVTARVPNQAEQTVAEGEFTVAVESEAREATELQSLAAAQDEFLLSLVALRLEQQDLVAEAIAVYEKLAKLSAKTSAYHAALSELYDRAGRSKEAAEARERAAKLGFKFR
jgi:hypothetical protein